MIMRALNFTMCFFKFVRFSIIEFVIHHYVGKTNIKLQLTQMNTTTKTK